jgi:DNA-binding transcriptional ArsR family regulator
MRSSPPPLLPLLRSQVQGGLLALLYLHPDREYSLSEIAAEIGVSVKAVHHEASRLVTAGMIHDRRRGNMRLLRAVTDSPLTRPLTDLLAVTYGPLPVLSDALAPVPGVEEAFIYGSWAARYHGEPGPVPADVDVLVVGSADLDQLEETARAAQQRLGRQVNIRRVRPRTWRSPDPADPFLASVRSRPLVELRLSTGGDTDQVRTAWGALT